MRYRGYLISHQPQSKNHDFSVIHGIIDLIEDEEMSQVDVCKKLNKHNTYVANMFRYWGVKKDSGPLATARESMGTEPTRATIAMSKLYRIMADTAESMEKHGIIPAQQEEDTK